MMARPSDTFGHCCLALGLVERQLAGAYRLSCSPTHCCRAELALIADVHTDLERLEDQDGGKAA